MAGASGTSRNVKMRVSGTNIGHSGTYLVGGVFGTRYCEKCACVAHWSRLAGTLAGSRRRWTVQCNYSNGLNGFFFFFYNALWKGKQFKICLATKTCDALERNILQFVKITCSGKPKRKFRVENGGVSPRHIPNMQYIRSAPPTPGKKQQHIFSQNRGACAWIRHWLTQKVRKYWCDCGRQNETMSRNNYTGHQILKKLITWATLIKIQRITMNHNRA